MAKPKNVQVIEQSKDLVLIDGNIEENTTSQSYPIYKYSGDPSNPKGAALSCWVFMNHLI